MQFYSILASTFFTFNHKKTWGLTINTTVLLDKRISHLVNDVVNVAVSESV